MGEAHFRFFDSLNDFLQPEKQKEWFGHRFEGRGSVKDLIESLGVPHPEIDLILANGESVDFDYIVGDGDWISVYPIFESIDISRIRKIHREALPELRFILDVHLGKLTGLLRLLGFDCLYRNDYQDPVIAQISQESNRILLTRDRNLLKRNIVTYGYCIRHVDPKMQLVEVIHRFDLARSAKPFSRCLKCNGDLEEVEKSDIEEKLNPTTSAVFQSFFRCRQCFNIYWQGSHFEKLKCFLKDIEKIILCNLEMG